jgi:sulfur transfer complex TusBCD TusB component (DsrH family)
MKALNIVESAYRATLEEQDDTIVWLTAALKGAGAELSVLLRGNAVNYAVKGQDASGLSFGSWDQTRPPRIGSDIASLMDEGINVYVLTDDLVERCIADDEVIPGARKVGHERLPELFAAHDQVWHW